MTQKPLRWMFCGNSLMCTLLVCFSTRLKNAECKLAQQLRGYSSKSRLLLTGELAEKLCDVHGDYQLSTEQLLFKHNARMHPNDNILMTTSQHVAHRSTVGLHPHGDVLLALFVLLCVLPGQARLCRTSWQSCGPC